MSEEDPAEPELTEEVVSEIAAPQKIDEDRDDEEDDGKKDDDSDDSGKMSVESDESSFHASDYENDSGYDPDRDNSEMLDQAQTFKEEGNDLFQKGDLVRASRSYKKGISLLKPINKENADDEQVKALLVTLGNNLSMVCMKQGKPKLALDVATKAIEVDDTNCKAFYRRAVAQKKLGNFKEARRDLKDAYKCDPKNATVKKELHALVKYMTDTANRERAAAKAVFSFDNKTSVLYEDKLEEERKKKEEEEQKKREEEEQLAKRKKDWEDECVKLLAAGKEAISYEDWDKARKKKEKAARKAKKQEDRKRAEEQKKELERLKQERAAAKKLAAVKPEEDSDDDDDIKLTEAELSQFRGYKKTADGKTTSYFTREPSDLEKQLIGDTTPQRLDANGEPTGTGPARLSPNPSTSDIAAGGKGKASAWNAGGTTWEEKDATDWCNNQLQFRLKESISKEAPFVGVITEVDKLAGEASVAVAGGRKRYIFDFHCNLKYEIRDDDVDEVIASGELRLPDINSGNHDDFEIELSAWKSAPSEANAQKAAECQKSLVKAVRVSVLDFVNDFNGHY